MQNFIHMMVEGSAGSKRGQALVHECFSRSVCVIFTNLSVGKAGCEANPESRGERSFHPVMRGVVRNVWDLGFCFVLQSNTLMDCYELNCSPSPPNPYIEALIPQN